MITIKQRERAEAFLKLHLQGEMFVLPNVWNAMSAKIFEKEGFKAIATSSAGLHLDLHIQMERLFL